MTLIRAVSADAEFGFDGRLYPITLTAVTNAMTSSPWISVNGYSRREASSTSHDRAETTVGLVPSQPGAVCLTD